jgi:sensor histidine kinase YesM
MQNNLTHILSHTDTNGITIFVASFLFTLSVYHFFLYFQHKDKTYLYYSLYTLLTFIYIFPKAHHFFLTEITSSNIKKNLIFYSSALQWVFNTIYLIFVIHYIDLKKHRKQWFSFLKKAIVFYSVLLLILLVITYRTGSNAVLDSVYAFFFIPTMTIIAIITVIIIYRINSVIKYYLIIGTTVYLSLAIYSYYSSMSAYGTTFLYYIALLIENIFFALGLGAKQKMILTEKNKFQKALIKEHQENSKLQKKISEKLDFEVAQKTKEIIALNKEKEKETKKKLAAEFSKRTLDLRMQALQTQMNPHFLFNSLNAIKHYIIKNNKEDASFFLSKLSKLIRKILENSQLFEITLSQEIEVMQLYVEVENMRLDKSISLKLNMDENCNLNAIKIPPLVLQPFIENAIWHGLSLKKGQKNIIVSIEQEGLFINIKIQDNGIGREQAAINKSAKLIDKKSLGISLTKKRLLAYFEGCNEKPKIYFEDLYSNNKPTGTLLIVKIPAIY